MAKVDLNQGQKGLSDNEPKNADTEEMREIKMILSWGQSAEAGRKDQVKMWPQYRNSYKGKTWQSAKAKGGKEMPEMNITRSTIQSILPILTDAIPGFTPIPKTPDSNEFAEMLGDQVESIWERQSMPIKIVEVLTDQSVVNVGIMKVTWDQELEDGQGDVKIERKDPKNILVGKPTIDFDRDCQFVIEKMRKTVGEWKTLYPDSADRIKPDKTGGGVSDPADNMGTIGDGTIQLVSPVDRDQNKTNGATGRNMTDDNLTAEGWEVWYTDNAVETYELEGEEKEKVTKKRFPNGHLTTILPNSKVRLQSVRNPYEGPQHNPYVKFVDTVVPGEFYGEGQVEPLLPTQKMINKAVQGILEYFRLMSNPVWIMDKNSGVDKNRITNKTGLIIEKNPGTEVKREQAPPLGPAVFDFIALLNRAADTISGVQDVTQGRKPTGITAAEAIAQLEEAAQTRIRLKERNMNNSEAQMARLVLNRILQFYRGNRYRRVSGKDTKTPDFVEFNIEEVPPGEDMVPMKRINTRKIVWDVENQKYTEMPVKSAESAQTVFDVKVSSGSSMPLQKTNRANLAMRLRQQGDLTLEGLFDALDFPDAEKEISRVKEEQAQLAAQQPPAGP